MSLHYNGDSSYLFVNGKEIINFKTKDSEIVLDPLCYINFEISKDFDLKYMEKIGLTGCMAIANDKILDIHKYLMEKNNNII